MDRLPIELIHQIVDNLAADDVINLCNSQPYFKAICNDEDYWKRRAEKELNIPRQFFDISPAERFIQLSNLNTEGLDSIFRYEMLRNFDSNVIKYLLSKSNINIYDLGFFITYRVNLFYYFYENYPISYEIPVFKNDFFYPIIAAIDTENTKILKLLLENPKLDPNYNNGMALSEAIDSENVDIIKLLLMDPRIKVNDEHIISAADDLRYELLYSLLSKLPRNHDLNNILGDLVRNDRYAGIIWTILSSDRFDLSRLNFQKLAEKSIFNTTTFRILIGLAPNLNYDRLVELALKYDLESSIREIIKRTGKEKYRQKLLYWNQTHFSGAIHNFIKDLYAS